MVPWASTSVSRTDSILVLGVFGERDCTLLSRFKEFGEIVWRVPGAGSVRGGMVERNKLKCEIEQNNK